MEVSKMKSFHDFFLLWSFSGGLVNLVLTIPKAGFQRIMLSKPKLQMKRIFVFLLPKERR
jgi:hypothetical protein